VPEPNRILRFAEVSARVGLKRTAIYDRIKAGTFPQPVALSEHHVGWYESEVTAWIASLPRVGVSTGVSTGDKAA
jgi:prophage regulatory protein